MRGRFNLKQALILVDEINRKKKAMTATKSVYLWNDYAKSISSDIKELQDYCRFKKLNFKKLMSNVL